MFGENGFCDYGAHTAWPKDAHNRGDHMDKQDNQVTHARARRVVKIAIDHGFCIVSGLAAGIDTVAHETALDCQSLTIAVMETPIDECYPKENESLKRRIEEQGLVLSQFPPGTKIRRSNFPQRNALMAELSAITIVIEAGELSGTRLCAVLNNFFPVVLAYSSKR